MLRSQTAGATSMGQGKRNRRIRVKGLSRRLSKEVPSPRHHEGIILRGGVPNAGAIMPERQKNRGSATNPSTTTTAKRPFEAFILMHSSGIPDRLQVSKTLSKPDRQNVSNQRKIEFEAN